MSGASEWEYETSSDSFPVVRAAAGAAEMADMTPIASIVPSARANDRLIIRSLLMSSTAAAAAESAPVECPTDLRPQSTYIASEESAAGSTCRT